MSSSQLNEMRQPRRSASVNQGPELGSGKLAPNGGKWVIKAAKMGAALAPVVAVRHRAAKDPVRPKAVDRGGRSGRLAMRQIMVIEVAVCGTKVLNRERPLMTVCGYEGVC